MSGNNNANLPSQTLFSMTQAIPLDLVADRPDGGCPICYDSFELNTPDKLAESVIMRGCRHIFHAVCLSVWFDEAGENAGTCPMCQEPLFRRRLLAEEPQDEFQDEGELPLVLESSTTGTTEYCRPHPANILVLSRRIQYTVWNIERHNMTVQSIGFEDQRTSFHRKYPVFLQGNDFETWRRDMLEIARNRLMEHASSVWQDLRQAVSPVQFAQRWADIRRQRDLEQHEAFTRHWQELGVVDAADNMRQVVEDRYHDVPSENNTWAVDMIAQAMRRDWHHLQRMVEAFYFQGTTINGEELDDRVARMEEPVVGGIEADMMNFPESNIEPDRGTSSDFELGDTDYSNSGTEYMEIDSNLAGEDLSTSTSSIGSESDVENSDTSASSTEPDCDKSGDYQPSEAESEDSSLG